MGGQKYSVGYLPGDSDSGMFGGNSNWRGPVWMPVNFLLYTALMRLGAYYGDDFTIECPTGSGNLMNLFQVAKELGERLIGTFVKDSAGKRPVYGSEEKFQVDPFWRDNVLFFEYFNGDTGAGVEGAIRLDALPESFRPMELSMKQASPNPMLNDAPSGWDKARPKSKSTLRSSQNEGLPCSGGVQFAVTNRLYPGRIRRLTLKSKCRSTHHIRSQYNTPSNSDGPSDQCNCSSDSDSSKIKSKNAG